MHAAEPHPDLCYPVDPGLKQGPGKWTTWDVLRNQWGQNSRQLPWYEEEKDISKAEIKDWVEDEEVGDSEMVS